MKKHLKICSVLLAIFVLLTSVLSVSAASYLTSDGFSYATKDTDLAVIYDYDNRNLDVTIPRMFGDYYVSEIGEYAFMNNKEITSISFAEAKNLKKLNTFALSGCTNLTSIVLPTWVNEISVSTFQNCTNLSTVTIYSNIVDIPSQAFYKCTSLKSINLPESLSTIGRYAFGNCTSLESIVIPKYVDSIDKTAFYKCDNLTIQCYTDSYAHNYAVENNIPFELLDAPKYELGDVDLSGRVDINDATDIQRFAAELITFDELQLSLADVRADEVVNISDATAIQKLLVSK